MTSAQDSWNKLFSLPISMSKGKLPNRFEEFYSCNDILRWLVDHCKLRWSRVKALVTAAVFSAAYSNSYHSFWVCIRPRSNSTNFNLFWVKYHPFSVNNHGNLLSVSIVIVLQKGSGPITRWQNAAPNFCNIFFCLYFWARQFLPLPRAFYTIFFLPIVQYCIKAVSVYASYFRADYYSIIAVPRAFFIRRQCNKTFFALPLIFWWTEDFCYRFQLLPPYFFIHRPCII